MAVGTFRTPKRIDHSHYINERGSAFLEGDYLGFTFALLQRDKGGSACAWNEMMTIRCNWPHTHICPLPEPFYYISLHAGTSIFLTLIRGAAVLQNRENTWKFKDTCRNLLLGLPEHHWLLKQLYLRCLNRSQVGLWWRALWWAGLARFQNVRVLNSGK